MKLTEHAQIIVHQVFEGFELLGFETRNKYQILSQSNERIAFAAEQQKGFFGFLARQFLGHWRKFTIVFFDNHQNEMMKAIHPFRFFFQRLEITDSHGKVIGGLQQRFAIFSKKFDIFNHHGKVIMEMRSPFFKIWTFPIYLKGQEVACI